MDNPTPPNAPESRKPPGDPQSEHVGYPRGRIPTALVTWALLGIVLMLVMVLVVLKVTQGTTTVPPKAVTAAPESVVQSVAGLTSADFYEAGNPGPPLTTPPSHVANQPLLTQNGKVVVFFAGAEFCPYCASERWVVLIALDRFGSFTGLVATSSSSHEAFGKIQTLSFNSTSYSSRYITLSRLEEYGDTPAVSAPGGFPSLGAPSAQQSAILARYDQSPYVTTPGDLPFLDVGDQFVWGATGAGYSPSVLYGQSIESIATDLHDPHNLISRSLLSAANQLTAVICFEDGGLPGSVCSSDSVSEADLGLGLGGKHS